jgi:hypothetical protein
VQTKDEVNTVTIVESGIRPNEMRVDGGGIKVTTRLAPFGTE